MQELVFASGPALRYTAILVFSALVVLSFLIWSRSGRTRRVALTESLRLLAAAVACATLLQPEWRTETRPDRQPSVVVLWDDSHSMQTLDVERTSADGGMEIITRAEWTSALIDSTFWRDLAPRNRVLVESFDTPADPDRPETSGTDINTSLNTVLDREENLRAVILASDGDWNIGESPVEAAARYWTRRVPVFPIPVGAPRALPDLALTQAAAPAFGIAGDKVQISFTVRNTMPDAVTTTVELIDERGQRGSQSIKLPPLREVTESFFWTPAEEGINTVTLRVLPVPGEAIEDNNERTLQINARKESIKVLVIDSMPRWEYRFIRNALSRDPGVEVSCLLFHPDEGVRGGGPDYIEAFPSDPGELSNYDVVFLGDVGVLPGQLTREQAAMLRALVEEQASGLVFIPGRQGNQNSLVDTALGDLMPVLLDPDRGTGIEAPAPSPLTLTESGRRNLLTLLATSEEENQTLWRRLPGFFWAAPILKARAGADVLAVHDTLKNDFGRLPLLVTSTVGTGKVLYLGTDAAWRWRRGVEDLYHYRFWGQVARWMSYQRKMAEGEKLRLFYAPENPVVGVTLTLNANAYDDFGVPLQNGSVILDITTPDERTQRLDMRPAAAGSFTASVALTQAGEHEITAVCPENGDSVTTKFHVQGEPVERLGQPANLTILSEIARITRGEMADPANVAALVANISNLADPAPTVQTIRLWSHWGWGAALLLVLTALWISRKAIGAI